MRECVVCGVGECVVCGVGECVVCGVGECVVWVSVRTDKREQASHLSRRDKQAATIFAFRRAVSRADPVSSLRSLLSDFCLSIPRPELRFTFHTASCLKDLSAAYLL